jgi:diadenosine tetraphosphate (Ap4A) HIT family hydrolase
MRDLSQFTAFPFELPVTVRPLAAPVEVEPVRAGEGGRDCRLCDLPDTDFAWTDADWRLRTHRPSPLPGVMILSPRPHIESIAELPPRLAAGLAPLLGRIQRAIEGLGGIGRVHLNYWGDGSAHLHLWFFPRPYGALQLRGTFLGMWSLLLPNLPDEQADAAATQIARALDATPTSAVPGEPPQHQ